MKFHEISQTGLVSRSCQTRKSFDMLPVVASMPERPQEVKNSEHSVSGFGIGWQSLQPWFRGSDGDADGMQGGLIWTPPTKRTCCYGLIGNVNILYIHVCGEHVANRGRQKKVPSTCPRARSWSFASQKTPQLWPLHPDRCPEALLAMDIQLKIFYLKKNGKNKKSKEPITLWHWKSISRLWSSVGGPDHKSYWWYKDPITRKPTKQYLQNDLL